MALTYARGEIYGPNQQGKDASKSVWDEQTVVGDDLQTIGVVHGIVGDEKNF
jgi:hypothetical protein